MLDWLQENDIRCIRGNHDAMLTGAMPIAANKDEVYQIEDTYQHIRKKNLDFIQSWPDKIEENLTKSIFSLSMEHRFSVGRVWI